MKILLVEIGNVIGANGGTERVICNMANAMDERGHDVTILTFDKHCGKMFFPLRERVKFDNLGEGKHYSRFFVNLMNAFSGKDRKEYNRVNFICEKIKNTMQRYVSEKQPDIVVCYEKVSLMLFTKFVKTKAPKIMMFHSTPSAVLDNQYLYGCFRIADCLQVLLPNDIERVSDILGSCQRMECIGNMVPQWHNTAIDYGSSIIVCVSLVEKKDKKPHLLVEAFSKISKKHPQWKVQIWGNKHYDKKYTQEIEDYVRNNGLEQQVMLCDSTNNVKQKLSKASIFCLPSHNEGFSLAMTEAMSMGLACVGFEDCTGINEIIKNGANGLLVRNNIDSLATALEKLISDKDLREQLGRKAQKDIKGYSPEIIWNQWECLFNDLCGKEQKG